MGLLSANRKSGIWPDPRRLSILGSCWLSVAWRRSISRWRPSSRYRQRRRRRLYRPAREDVHLTSSQTSNSHWYLNDLAWIRCVRYVHKLCWVSHSSSIAAAARRLRRAEPVTDYYELEMWIQAVEGYLQGIFQQPDRCIGNFLQCRKW